MDGEMKSQRHTGGDNLSKFYLDSLVEFQTWCESRGLSMRIRLAELMQREMRIPTRSAEPPQQVDPPSRTPAKSRPKRRVHILSAEGRARIVAAQRKRWDAIRAKQILSSEAQALEVSSHE